MREKQYKTGLRLEAIAERYKQLPFEVRFNWTPPTLDWCEHNEDLEAFCKRVKDVTALLGPPDETEGSHLFGCYSATDAPDLKAEWRCDDEGWNYRVVVRSFSPKGCKLDPRSEFVKGKETKIHPECAAVLARLQDA